MVPKELLMKILTMCQDFKKGGFYERFASMIEAMLEQDWEVHYISTQRFPIKNKNLHFHHVKEVKGISAPMFAKFMPQAIVKSMALNNKQSFDKIVVFGSAYGFIGWALKKVYSIPMITFLRADLLDNLKIQGRSKLVKPVSMMQRFAFRASDKIVVNTAFVGEKIQQRYKIPKEKISLVYNDIPIKFREPAKVKRSNDIGFVGVIEKRKGIDTLLEAFSKIHDKISSNLIVVGEGPISRKIEKYIKKKGLEKRVKMSGWKNEDEVKKLISSFSLLVVPSLSEGCPNTVLEALGCNTPCIGSGIREIREILKHDELLFTPEDPDDTAKKILYALENRENIQKLCSERKKEFIFDWKAACIKTIKN